MAEHRISKIGLKRLKEEFPRGFSDSSYGIIPKQPRPEDTMYVLDYDPQKRYLKLNGFVIQTFQYGSHADEYFSKLFNENSRVKKVTVRKPARAGVLVNNIKMPLF